MLHDFSLITRRRIIKSYAMNDPLMQLADALGRILAHTLYREQKEQEAMQRQLDELDAIAARTQHLAPIEGTEYASGDLRAIQ